jgi:outer membrane protein assembly factor BamE (lipoprotein component of BamABCDE complex)
MKVFFTLVSLFSFLSCLSGCVPASQHSASVQQGIQGERLTVGTVQREIRKGMSGADVVQVLGSPNIVTTDEMGREVWVYDKISTDRAYSSSAGGVYALILGSSAESGAASTSQQTLTVVIKFDEQKKVRDFAYHASRF